MNWYEQIARPETVGWQAAIVSLLLAFALTQAISAIYIWTFRGLSYSRTLVQGMAMASIVTAMLMLAIGNSIAAGIGIAGGLSIIRFRTTMRDPRDMVFVFAALAAGIASGLQAYAAAIAGTGMFLVAAVFLHVTSFGSRRQMDGLIRFVAPRDAGADEAIAHTLRQFCRSFVLVTLREAAQGTAMEHAYQVSVRDPARRNQLVTELQAVQGVKDVTFLLQEPTLEL
ncbi:MAG: DUF4956 domain-containing protein [Myxococcales bacterium]|nr:DUF4956 domain-containing protein [Myxococcales bacterium]